MSTAITFAGNSLQSATIISNRIQQTQAPGRRITTQRKPGDDGFKILSNLYDKRIIKLKLVVKGTSQANLETNIDTLKQNLGGESQNLDIAFAGSTRRYVATLESLEPLNEEHWSITMREYIATFICDPFGKATSSTNHSDDAIAASPRNSSLTIAGTVGPQPVITITVNAETNMTVLKFKNNTTDEEITITQGFNAADVLEIDTANLTVKVNGTEVDFTGPFPAFLIGSNSYTITITDSGAFNIDLDIDYTPSYL